MVFNGYYFWWCPIYPKWDSYQPLPNVVYSPFFYQWAEWRKSTIRCSSFVTNEPHQPVIRHRAIPPNKWLPATGDPCWTTPRNHGLVGDAATSWGQCRCLIWMGEGIIRVCPLYSIISLVLYSQFIPIHISVKPSFTRWWTVRLCPVACDAMINHGLINHGTPWIVIVIAFYGKCRPWMNMALIVSIWY